MDNIRGLTTGKYERQTYVNETVEQKREIQEKQPSERNSETPEIKVSLSSDSKDLQTARNSAISSPSTENPAERLEKVEKLKQEVEEGRYQINPEQVAEKMIGLIVDEFV